MNTECCYQQQWGYDNSHIDSYQNRPIQHYYSSPCAHCLLQSKINSILQSRSILTTLILPTFGRMTALFWAFIYSWALYPDGNKKGRIFVAQTSMYKHITYDNEHSNACQRRECCEGQVGGNSLSRKLPPYSECFVQADFLAA